VTLVAVANTDLHGGDITFDADDRLMLWTNGSGPTSGMYEMDPATAQVTVVDTDPGMSYSGLASLGTRMRSTRWVCSPTGCSVSIP
jgi:hypothetical protein